MLHGEALTNPKLEMAAQYMAKELDDPHLVRSIARVTRKLLPFHRSKVSDPEIALKGDGGNCAARTSVAIALGNRLLPHSSARLLTVEGQSVHRASILRDGRPRNWHVDFLSTHGDYKAKPLVPGFSSHTLILNRLRDPDFEIGLATVETDRVTSCSTLEELREAMEGVTRLKALLLPTSLDAEPIIQAVPRSSEYTDAVFNTQSRIATIAVACIGHYESLEVAA